MFIGAGDYSDLIGDTKSRFDFNSMTSSDGETYQMADFAFGSLGFEFPDSEDFYIGFFLGLSNNAFTGS